MSRPVEHHQFLVPAGGPFGADLGDDQAHLVGRHRDGRHAWAGELHEDWAEQIDLGRPDHHRGEVASARAPRHRDAPSHLRTSSV